jgi:membrane protein DedA with SNARE-associated domain
MTAEPGFLASLLQFISEHAYGLGAGVLFLSSLIEYVFPPFPGDLITLFGAYLVVNGSWSFWFAMAVTCAGSLVGAALDYGIGHWLSHRLEKLPSERETKRWTPLTREKYALLNERFRRHGAVYILINRFLPGIRAFFFVVAGASGMPLPRVLLYAGLSAIGWNALILGVGYSLGASWERLQAFFGSYNLVAWCILGALAVALLVVWLVRRRKRVAGEGGR